MTDQIPTIVQIIPKKVWIESDFIGARHVMVQHQMDGELPFCYASFHYNYRYTSNGGTLAAAEALAREMGATDPIEHSHRALQRSPE